MVAILVMIVLGCVAWLFSWVATEMTADNAKSLPSISMLVTTIVVSIGFLLGVAELFFPDFQWAFALGIGVYTSLLAYAGQSKKMRQWIHWLLDEE